MTTAKTTKTAPKKAAPKKPAAKTTAATQTTKAAPATPVVDTTTTTPSPTPAPAAAQTTTTNTPAADLPVGTVDEVRTYLTAQDVTIEEKLTRLSVDGFGSVRSLASTLESFVNDMGPGTPELEPKVVLGKLYNLYICIKSCVETKDQSEYMLKMDILNLAFVAYGGVGQALSAVMLLRYDYAWSWGADALKTYQVLVVAISTLADRTTRKEQIKRININNSFARTGLAITQDDVQRLITYYTA